MGDNDVDLESDELGDDLRDALGFPLHPPVLDCYGTTLDPTEFAQPLRKRGGPRTLGGTRTPAHKSNRPQRGLRMRRERPGRRGAAEKRDELAALHCRSSRAPCR